MISLLESEQGPQRLSYLPHSPSELTKDQHGFQHIHLPYEFLLNRVTFQGDQSLSPPQTQRNTQPEFLRLSTAILPPVLVGRHTLPTQPLRPVSHSSGPVRRTPRSALRIAPLFHSCLVSLTWPSSGPADVSPTPTCAAGQEVHPSCAVRHPLKHTSPRCYRTNPGRPSSLSHAASWDHLLPCSHAPALIGCSFEPMRE